MTMSNGSDPAAVLAALDRAQDAFEMVGRGRTAFEAYALAMTNDTLQDFQDHQFSYERAHQIGLFERETAEAMKDLYSENRTESYYGGGRPTQEQAEAMTDLASAVHQFAVSQIREGGVCLCD